MTAPAETPPDAMDMEQIRREMARIRHELHYDVRGAVEGARTLTDFSGHIRAHPWLSVALAVAAGYLIVPRRQRPSVIVAPPEPAPSGGPRPEDDRGGKQRPGLLRKAAGLALPLLWRVGRNYAEVLASNWLLAHASVMPGPRPPEDPPHDTTAGPSTGRAVPPRGL